jgi:hypothetical protein
VAPLLLLPVDLLRAVCLEHAVPLEQHLRLAHVCRALRSALCGVDSEPFGGAAPFWNQVLPRPCAPCGCCFLVVVFMPVKRVTHPPCLCLCLCLCRRRRAAQVCAVHWHWGQQQGIRGDGADGGPSPSIGPCGQRLHCSQSAVVLHNARLLCSATFRAALKVHYVAIPPVSGGGAPPTLQLCDPNAGSPALFNTPSPLSACLLLDDLGKILGFAIYVTVRFRVSAAAAAQQGAGAPSTTTDVRNYLVVKRGQCVGPAVTSTDPGRRRRPRRRGERRPPPAQQWRYRRCGEHSALVQGIESGAVATATVCRAALVQLDPRRHSVAHAMSSCSCCLALPASLDGHGHTIDDHVGGGGDRRITALQAATLAQTRQFVATSLRGKAPKCLF